MRQSLGVFLAFTLVTAVQAATPPADPPFRVWGQVTGTAPVTALEAQLVLASGGSPVVTAAARITPTTGGSFYEAAFPAGPVKAATTPLVLRFSGPASAATSTVPYVPGPVPFLVHCAAGNPALPTGNVLLAEARLGDDARITYLSVFSRIAGTPAGSVNWQGTGIAPTPPFSQSAKVPGLTVHRASVAATAGVTPPVVWSASFRSTEPAEPWLHARTLLADVEQTVVDNLGTASGDLPDVADLALADKVYKLGTDAVAIEAGDYLSLHLQTSVSGESAVRSALTSWTLSAPAATGTTAPLALPLSTCTVQPIPGGSWVSATWLVPKKVTLTQAALVGPASATLTGSWKVRSLTRFVLVGSKEEF